MLERIISNGQYTARVDEKGEVTITDLDGKLAFSLDIMPGRYKYLSIEWEIFAQLFFSPDNKYLIVTYGYGYVYIINLEQRIVVKEHKFFGEISYEEDDYFETPYSFGEINVQFSANGNYAAFRIRGDYDPNVYEEETLIFYRSVHVLDMENLEIAFSYDCGDLEEKTGRNLAVLDFSPNEKYLLTGALGNALKIFDLVEAREIDTFGDIGIVTDNFKMRNCELAKFIDDSSFVYVDADYYINYVVYNGKKWTVRKKIKTSVLPHVMDAENIYSKWSYILWIKYHADTDEIEYAREDVNYTKPGAVEIIDRVKLERE